MPFFHHVLRVKVKSHFLALPVEIVEDAQLFLRVQLGAFGTEGGEMGNKVGSHAGKIRPGFFNILFHYRYGEVFFLHNPVRAGGFVQQHLVVFPAVFVPEVAAQGHEDRLLKVGFVQAPVVDGDFGGRAGIKAVEQFRIG